MSRPADSSYLRPKSEEYSLSVFSVSFVLGLARTDLVCVSSSNPEILAHLERCSRSMSVALPVRR